MASNRQEVTERGSEDTAKTVDLMELLFFAYRDFISDPDEILNKYGFGRAHHRVIHFVGRYPGIRVAELLDILRITKQSLGRVLKELIDTEYVMQQEGETDRRRRLLYLTERGCELHRELMLPQIQRFNSAIGESGASQLHRDLLFHLINEDDRDHVQKLLGRASDHCSTKKES